MANKEQVISCHARGWTNRRIADELGCLPEYVSATLRRQNLTPNYERDQREVIAELCKVLRACDRRLSALGDDKSNPLRRRIAEAVDKEG